MKTCYVDFTSLGKWGDQNLLKHFDDVIVDPDSERLKYILMIWPQTEIFISKCQY